MKARTVTLSLCAVLALLLSGCGSLKRAGKDLAIVATCPVTIPLASLYESLDWGPETGSAQAVWVAPVAFTGRLVKHAAFTTAYAADLFAAPFYLLASIDPKNDLEPINLYALDGYPWPSAAVPHIEE